MNLCLLVVLHVAVFLCPSSVLPAYFRIQMTFTCLCTVCLFSLLICSNAAFSVCFWGQNPFSSFSFLNHHPYGGSGCVSVGPPSHMPFNYIKRKHGRAICWCDARTHCILNPVICQALVPTASLLPTRSETKQESWIQNEAFNKKQTTQIRPLRLSFTYQQSSLIVCSISGP